MSSDPRITPSDLSDTQIAVIAEVSWTGRTWLLGSVEVEGDDYHALPGMTEIPEITDELSLSGGQAGDVSISISIILPIDVSAYVDAGYDLEDMEVEVSLVWHRDGVGVHSWAARHVHLSGSMSAGQWGSPDRPAGWVSGDIIDSPYRVVRPLVPIGAEVNPVTAPTSSESPGTRIPLVFGSPTPSSASASDEGPPAPVLEEAAGNVAYVAVSIGDVEASQVTLIDSSGTATAYPVTRWEDGLGRVIAAADLTSAAVPAPETFHSDWSLEPAFLPFGSDGPLMVAAWLLSMGGADIDLPEWVRVGRLVGGSVAGYIDDWEARPWEIVADILSSLPVGLRKGDGGWAPCILDPALARDLAAETIRENNGWRRESQWQTEAADLVSSVDVAYSLGEVDSSSFTAPIPAPWIAHLRHTSSISQNLAWTWDPAGAYMAASWLARSKSLGWLVSAWSTPAQFATPIPGDWIRLIDASDAMKYALVVRRTITEDPAVDYTLALPRGA